MGALKNIYMRSDTDWRQAKVAKAHVIAASAEPAYQNSFAGFIFVCNDSTIPDVDRQIFGLTARHAESVRAIRKGMPLFLYNYSTRFLHGVFEATSNGGYNIDPYAWKNTEASANGKAPISRYPAQVRVRVVDKMQLPLQLDDFSPVLDHDDDGKFKLELTQLQVQRLLQLFRASSARLEQMRVNNWTGDGSAYSDPLLHENESNSFVCRNDLDSCSVSSSGSTHSQEGDWRERGRDAYLNGHMQESFDDFHCNTEVVDCLSFKAKKLSLESKSTKGSSYLDDRIRDQVEKKHRANSNMLLQELSTVKKVGQRMQYKNCMVSRLQDSDPAVNSNSGNGVLHVSRSVGRKDEFLLVASNPLNSHRTKRTEPNPSSSGWSRQSSRKHGTDREKLHRKREKHTEFQLKQVSPICYPISLPLQEQTQLLALLPQSTPLAIHDTQIRDEICELYESPTDGAPLHEGIPSVLPPGQWGMQVPILLMPPPMQKVHEPLNMPLDVAALHREIVQFAKLARPSLHAQLQAEAAIHCIRSVVKRIWPEADVEVFGSFATGLCLRHSDVDLAVVGAPLPHTTEFLSVAQASSTLIRELASALESSKWFETIIVLDTASMPVLKCHCQPLTLQLESVLLPSIAVDITIGAMRSCDAGAAECLQGCDPTGKIGKLRSKHTGGLAREYVLQKICDLPALAPLALLLKSYLHHRGFNNVYLGGLGSFSLTLLLAFFLERVPISFKAPLDGMAAESPLSRLTFSEFPEDSDVGSSSSNSCLNFDHHTVEASGEHLLRRAANIMDRVLALWESGGSPLLGTLLLGFLQTFGFEVNLAAVKIVLKGTDGSLGGFNQRDNDSRHIALWIDDPLRPGVNVGAGSFGMFHVQIAFGDMLEVFKNSYLSIAASPNSESICRDIPMDWCYLNRIFIAAEGSHRNI